MCECKSCTGLKERIFNQEADINYYECILDGSWPSAVTILTAALEKAKIAAKERGYE